jgi:BirA family biotin operon repressor/biotin-[acetyl-CoA-carboxylase] ligase
VKQQALSGAEEGLVVIAEEQTCGKEKSGRVFYSPKGTGIYMSVLLRPKISMKHAFAITTSAAVAVAQAIEQVSERNAEIMWVNDIYCDGKKVCGILTEASYQMETGKFDYVIMGIGIHVKLPESGMPVELGSKTDCVFQQTETDVRSQLVAQVLTRFWDFYQRLESLPFLEEYIQRSCFIGKNVTIETKEGIREGNVLSVNRQCHLVVAMDDGTEEEFSAGTVRLKNDCKLNTG